MNKSDEKPKKKVQFKTKSPRNDTKDEKRRKLKGDPVQRSLKSITDLASLAKPIPKYRKYGAKRTLEHLPVPKEKLAKYERGPGLVGDGIVTTFHQKKLKQKEEEAQFSLEQAARTEILLPEDEGYLQYEENENPVKITQKQLCDNVDITSATKHFNLVLNDFGPYRINYTRNGRHLLIGGRKGHLASFDWISKKLSCEINVMEEIFDVQWLHNELMFAVAQKKWVYIYDHQGVELHCIKKLPNVLRMEFLPYHFLLATCNDRGFLSWLDVSIGEIKASIQTHYGRLNIMTQNPYNALLCLGHSHGTVTMWSPNVNKPLVKMLCHTRPLQSVAIDPYGRYMATSDVGRNVKIWDLKNLNHPVQDYHIYGIASNLTFSQKSLLAWSLGNTVEVYRDCCATPAKTVYLRHSLHKNVAGMQFCPYEDVLGVGSAAGFTSLIVPGAGEPNFDALECNPYQSKKQRQEAEVKALLEKIPSELITLNPNAIAEVDEPTLEEKIEAKKALMFVKPPKIELSQRRGKKKGTAKVVHAKKIMREVGRKEFVKAVSNIVQEADTKQQENKPHSVLDRFHSKRK